MFLIASGTQELASWTCAGCETKASEENSKDYLAQTFSQKAEWHEHDTRITNGFVHLHRQMDPKGFVFAEKPASPPWPVAPSTREGVAAHADQNSAQSRIRGLNLPARDAVEGHHGRVFLNQTGKNNHRSTHRHVPMGKAIPDEGER